MAVSDVRGALRNSAGLDIAALYKYASEKKSVAGFPGGEHFPADKLLAESCDVLIPAAARRCADEGQRRERAAKIILGA